MIKQVVKFKKGDFLFKEGDTSDAMYIIEHGKFSITKMKGDSTVTLTELKAGDLLGEMAFFEQAPRSATAQVVTPTASVAKLPFNYLKQEYKKMPDWIKTIIKSINNNLRNANIRIQNLEEVVKDFKNY